MKRYPVIISATVQGLIDDQTLVIADDSLATALAWSGRLESTIQRLGEIPGFAVDEDGTNRMSREVRKFVFERTYLVH